jgi:adenylate cyclase
MRLKLLSVDGTNSVELGEGKPLVVGRAPKSDIPIIDPTISRRHAELEVTDAGIAIRDLGSSNGTFVNGARVQTGSAAPGDLISFGKVGFRLQPVAATPSGPTLAPASTPPTATILRQLPARDPNSPLTSAHRAAKPVAAVGAPGAAETLTPEDKSRQKLATLLEVSKGLGKAADIDALLEKIVRYAYQILEVDRVAILLLDGDELVPKIARDKRGGDTERAVPQSIARTALAEKVAILSDNAGQDTRFGGQSILMQQIRSAICCPLIGSEDNALGVLYIDNVTASHRFSDEDFEFSVAFAGIAAVAIENGQFAQRIQREALTRGNFERFFTPQLAKRIAESSESIRLGGDRRTVAVLFSDIRGFTALSETMRPEDTASLLTEYFTQMVDCVFRHEGTLDKFIGDAVMAQWGAPIGGPGDADKAMAAALDMMHAVGALNEEWRAAGRPEIHIGIGLNYGEAFAGNIGSDRRLEYTIIGDTVNTAKRVCSIAMEDQILITEEFRAALIARPPMVLCEPTDLKNKSQPVTVYRVLLA